MKQTMFGVAGGCVLVFFLLILMALYGRNARETEIQNALANAVETALSDVKKEGIGQDMDSDVFTADFLQSLLVQMNSESDVKVSVLEADPEKGILSVEVTETYLHPNGKRGTVSAVRNVIFDRTEPEAPAVYTISYFLPDNTLYKKYSLVKDSTAPVPVPPKEEGKTFDGWVYLSGGSGTAAFMEDTASGSSKQVLVGGDGNPIHLSEDVSLEAVFH